MRWRELAFGVVGGAVAGAVVMAWLAANSTASARHARGADETERADARTRESEPHTRARFDAPPPLSGATRDDDVRAPAEDSLESLLVRLHPHAEAGIRRGWTTKRTDEIPDEVLAEARNGFDALVREAPVRIGAELAERATRREKALADQSAGGAITLLDELAKGGTGPLADVVSDPKRFTDLFRSMSAGPTHEGLAQLDHLDRAAEDGATISFPAGVFRPKGLFAEKKTFPRDVTIAGAGMDATLLLLSDLSTRDELRNLTFRDCTLHTESDSLVDLRHRPATLQLTRVRLVGFDAGAGSSCAFEAPALALYARHSYFLGGYGRSPQHGGLFDVRSDALLARFERCTIDAVSLRVDWIRPGATVNFTECVLSNLLDSTVPAERPGLAFPGTDVGLYPGDRYSPPPKDLNELFPNWQQRVNQ